jgi:hypothetical protein
VKFQSAETLEKAIKYLGATASLRILLVSAFFWGGELPTQASIQQGFNQWSSTIDGSFYWGIAGVPGSGGSLDQLPSSESYASVVHGGEALYGAGNPAVLGRKCEPLLRVKRLLRHAQDVDGRDQRQSS